MANLMWCPNCEQKVSPQNASKGNRGCVVVILMGLSALLAFFNVLLGGLLFLATLFYLVVGLVMEVNSGLSKPSCPICKADNLQ